MVPYDQATDYTGTLTYSAECAPGYATTTARVLLLKIANAARPILRSASHCVESCVGGEPCAWWFFHIILLCGGVRLAFYDVSAGDMQSEINNFSGVDGVTVSRYTHLDDPFSGAWAVTFPATMGNVEALGLNDKPLLRDIGLIITICST